MQLRDTLRSLADLVLNVEQHEALAELDEDEDEYEYIRRIKAMRADAEKGRKIVQAFEELFDTTQTAEEHGQEIDDTRSQIAKRNVPPD